MVRGSRPKFEPPITNTRKRDSVSQAYRDRDTVWQSPRDL